MNKNRITFDEFDESLAVNPDNLDEEIIIHPSLVLTAGEEHAKAVADRDGLKAHVDEVYAEESLALREDASTKKTEDYIKQNTLISENYREAFKAYINAKKYADMWSVRKDAVSARGYTLKYLVDLQVNQIYSDKSYNDAKLNAREVTTKKLVDKYNS